MNNKIMNENLPEEPAAVSTASGETMAAEKSAKQKRPKVKHSKSSFILLLAAILLLGAGGFGTAWAASPAIHSDDYDAFFYLNHLQVHLMENGADVCGGTNTIDGSSKTTGKLMQYLVSSEGTAAGKIEPGRKYKEELAAKNGQDIPIFLRMTVRKYWIDTATGEKANDLSPNRIKLTYGKESYNTNAWMINESESTPERATYYYKTTLAAGATTEPLFDQLVIDSKVANIEGYTTRTEGNKIIYTYIYRYDGYACTIEADVQAVQTHNANDAIVSQWGVTNVAASFTSNKVDGVEAGAGTLSVG